MDDHKNFNCDLRRCNITLVNLGANSSGTYRCEISGEMPDFKFVSAAANMTVGGKCIKYGGLARIVLIITSHSFTI